MEDSLIDYSLYLKGDNLSIQYIKVNFCALRHFYFMNDVRINTVKIAKFLGDQTKKHVDRGYTHEEIKVLWDNSDLRYKTIILTFASTGIRLGLMGELKYSNLEKKENYGVYKFTIYEKYKGRIFHFLHTWMW